MWKYFALLTALAVVAPLPRNVGYFIGRVVADLSFLLASDARRNVAYHMKRALGSEGSKEAVYHNTLEVFRNTARNFYDLVTLPRFKANEIESRLTVQNWHYFEQALAQNRGIVLASVHMGNMDVAVQTLRARSVKLTILNEVISPPQFYRLNTRLREHHGISMLSVTYGGLKEAIRRLRNREVVAIACDRAIQNTGVRNCFLGEEAIIPIGAVELALRTGAVILPAFAVRLKGDRYGMFFEPPIDLSGGGEKHGIIQQTIGCIVTLMEKYIKLYSDQWMVFDPIWNRRGSPKRVSRYVLGIDHPSRSQGLIKRAKPHNRKQPEPMSDHRYVTER